MPKPTIRTMNYALYAASFHLLEAGKHLSNVEGFRPVAGELFEKAKFLANIIQEEPKKMTDERLDAVLSEIIGDEDLLK